MKQLIVSDKVQKEKELEDSNRILNERNQLLSVLCRDQLSSGKSGICKEKRRNKDGCGRNKKY